MVSAPTRLRLDHLAPGQVAESPRVSWWLPAESAVQRAYELRLLAGDDVVWESGARTSGESVLVDPAVPGDRHGTRWQVRVWTDPGGSDWSEPAPWRVGALPAALGAATWIEPDEPVVPLPGERPAYLLRHEFTLAARSKARRRGRPRTASTSCSSTASGSATWN